MRAIYTPVKPLCPPLSRRAGMHLGRPTMRYLRTLSNITSARSLVIRGTFLASAHRELGVALVPSRGDVYRSCALLFGKASGRQVLPGAHIAFLD
jgi:hypothetical protein